MPPSFQTQHYARGSRSILPDFLLDQQSNTLKQSPKTHVLSRRIDGNPAYKPGAGIREPEDFNNKGYFALFAILGAAMVLGAIWFFFWAKNGGFVWRKTDWDDYKSTVLRRKDANGRTLTNATPSTDLGQKSIAGTFDNDMREEMVQVRDFEEKRHTPRTKRPRQHAGRQHSDEDVRAYREERPARVGGLNRQHDGSHFDYTSTDYSYSDVVSNNSRTHLRASPTLATPLKKKGLMEKKRERRQEKRTEKNKKRVDKAAAKRPLDRAQRPAQRHGSLDGPNRTDGLGRYGHNIRDVDDSSYYGNMYRPQAPLQATYRDSPPRSPRHSQPASPGNSRQTSPRKRAENLRPPGSFDAYSDAGSSDTGTKSYAHHIPGLSKGSRDTGFRRGARARRDILSDSD